MYLIYLIFALTQSTVFCDIQRLEDGGLLVDFIIINKGQMTYPSILMFIEDVAIGECADTCIRHLSCVTFNYNWNTRDCELVDQKFDEFEAVVDDPNWYNYGTPEKIDGGWSNWITSPHCSASCENGTTTKYRTCTAPEPKYGGSPCVGDEVRIISCNAGPCPIDGGLSDWINVGKCSVTCGGGTIDQIKTCTNPAPQHGGKNCIEEPKQTISCNNHKCLDGGLSDWIDVGSCSVTCGGGIIDQIKTCTNPAPQHGGKNCTVEPKQTIPCNKQACPCKRTLTGTCCKDIYRYQGKLYFNECTYFSSLGAAGCIDVTGAIRRC